MSALSQPLTGDSTLGLTAAMPPRHRFLSTTAAQMVLAVLYIDHHLGVWQHTLTHGVKE